MKQITSKLDPTLDPYGYMPIKNGPRGLLKFQPNELSLCDDWGFITTMKLNSYVRLHNKYEVPLDVLEERWGSRRIELQARSFQKLDNHRNFFTGKTRH